MRNTKKAAASQNYVNLNENESKTEKIRSNDIVLTAKAISDEAQKRLDLYQESPKLLLCLIITKILLRKIF